ncbi:MAG TPA: hypothetical protein VF950_08250 [Planctomycetota bacterium]
MRWLVATLGVLGLAGAIYFGLEPRLRRPELRVALYLRPSDPDQAALAAGVALAIEERDERAGRYRVKAAHQIIQTDGSVDIPRPGPHTLLYGLEMPLHWSSDGPALPVDASREATILLAWMRDRNLTRLALPLPPPRPVGAAARKQPPSPRQAWTPSELELAAPAFHVETIAFEMTARNRDGWAAEILATRPDVVHLPSRFYGVRRALESAGFQGPVFAASESARENLYAIQDHLIVLAPLGTSPPPDFLSRHAHPYAYAGYRATLRYLDVLDTNPKADFTAVAKFPLWSGFDDLQLEPRVYRVHAGRFHPVPPK